jgi:protein-tyrosine phosphatase
MTVRLPAIEGSRNFRDLGGYPAADGRTTRWGHIYRSGSLAGLSLAGTTQLRALGIRALCDLRTTHEREHEPYAWCEGAGIAYWARDYETSFADLRTTLAAPQANPEATRAAMIGGYRHLPYDQAPAYARIFHWLAAGEVPVVFNCSAGKDRAGTAAALVLATLGVPRETVLADYALTDAVVDLRTAIGWQGHARPPPPRRGRRDPAHRSRLYRRRVRRHRRGQRIA